MSSATERPRGVVSGGRRLLVGVVVLGLLAASALPVVSGRGAALAQSAVPEWDPSLAALSLSGASLDFSPSDTSYGVRYLTANDYATVTAVAAHPSATVTISIDDDPDTEGHQVHIPGASGLGKFVNIDVVSADGTALRRYMLQVVDFRLGRLGVAGYDIGFDPTVTGYVLDVDAGVDQVTVETGVFDKVRFDPVADADLEAAGHQVDLVAGANTVTVTKYHPQETDTQPYTITINRPTDSGGKVPGDLGDPPVDEVFGGSVRVVFTDADATPLEGFALDAANRQARAVWSDGTTVWVSDLAGRLFAYVLATGARDADQDVTAPAGAGNRHGNGMWSDGTTIWVSDRRDMNVYAYDLDSGDRDTGSEFSLDAGNAHAKGVWSDGTTIWISDWDDDKLFAYDLDSGDRDPDSDIDLHPGDPDNQDDDPANGSAAGIWSDGATIWVLDDGALKIFAYDLDTGEHQPDLDIGGLADAGNDHPKGIWSNGATMLVTDKVDDHIYAYPVPTFTINSIDIVDPPEPEFELQSETPAVPTGLVVTPGFRHLMVSTDQADETTTDVRVKPASAPESDWAVTENISTRSGYNIVGLTSGVTYEVQVRARQGDMLSDWSASVLSVPSANLPLDPGHSRPVGIGGDGTIDGTDPVTLWVGDRDSREVRAYRYLDGQRNFDKDITMPSGREVIGVCATQREVIVALNRDVPDEFDLDNDGDEDETYEEAELLYYSTSDGSRNSRSALEVGRMAPGSLGCYSEGVQSGTQRSVLYTADDPANATSPFHTHTPGVLFRSAAIYDIDDENAVESLGTWGFPSTPLLWGGNDHPAGVAPFDSAAHETDDLASGTPLVWVLDADDARLYATSVDAPGRRLEPYEIDLAFSVGAPAGLWTDQRHIYVVDQDNDAEILSLAAPRPSGQAPVPLWAAVTTRAASELIHDFNLWVDFSHRLELSDADGAPGCFEASWWFDGVVAGSATVLTPTSVEVGSYRDEDRRWGIELVFDQLIPPGSAVRLHYTCSANLRKRGGAAASSVAPFTIDVHSRPARPPLIAFEGAGQTLDSNSGDTFAVLDILPATTIWFHPRRELSRQGTALARPEVQIREATESWSQAETLDPVYTFDSGWEFRELTAGVEHRTRYRTWVGELVSDWSPEHRATPSVIESDGQNVNIAVELRDGAFVAGVSSGTAAGLTWRRVWIRDFHVCDSTTNFDDAVSYTEGDAVEIPSSRIGQLLCFRATRSGATAYAVSPRAPGPPLKVESLAVEMTSLETATVSWTQPDDLSDGPVSTYEVRWSPVLPGKDREWTVLSLDERYLPRSFRRKLTITVPVDPARLQFQVRAVGPGGESGWSGSLFAGRRLRLPGVGAGGNEVLSYRPLRDVVRVGSGMYMVDADGAVNHWDLPTGTRTTWSSGPLDGTSMCAHDGVIWFGDPSSKTLRAYNLSDANRMSSRDIEIEWLPQGDDMGGMWCNGEFLLLVNSRLGLVHRLSMSDGELHTSWRPQDLGEGEVVVDVASDGSTVWVLSSLEVSDDDGRHLRWFARAYVLRDGSRRAVRDIVLGVDEYLFDELYRPDASEGREGILGITALEFHGDGMWFALQRRPRPDRSYTRSTDVQGIPELAGAAVRSTVDGVAEPLVAWVPHVTQIIVEYDQPLSCKPGISTYEIHHKGVDSRPRHAGTWNGRRFVRVFTPYNDGTDLRIKFGQSPRLSFDAVCGREAADRLKVRNRPSRSVLTAHALDSRVEITVTPGWETPQTAHNPYDTRVGWREAGTTEWNYVYAFDPDTYETLVDYRGKTAYRFVIDGLDNDVRYEFSARTGNSVNSTAASRKEFRQPYAAPEPPALSISPRWRALWLTWPDPEPAAYGRGYAHAWEIRYRKIGAETWEVARASRTGTRIVDGEEVSVFDGYLLDNLGFGPFELQVRGLGLEEPGEWSPIYPSHGNGAYPNMPFRRLGAPSDLVYLGIVNVSQFRFGWSVEPDRNSLPVTQRGWEVVAAYRGRLQGGTVCSWQATDSTTVDIAAAIESNALQWVAVRAVERGEEDGCSGSYDTVGARGNDSDWSVGYLGGFGPSFVAEAGMIEGCSVAASTLAQKLHPDDYGQPCRRPYTPATSLLGGFNPRGIWIDSSGSTGLITNASGLNVDRVTVVDSTDDEDTERDFTAASSQLFDAEALFGLTEAPEGDPENIPGGIWSDEENWLYVADREASTIDRYSLSTGERDEDKDPIQLRPAKSQYSAIVPTGIWSDGSTMWVADARHHVVYAIDITDDGYGNFLNGSLDACFSPTWQAGSLFDRYYDPTAFGCYTNMALADALGPDDEIGEIWSDGVWLWVAVSQQVDEFTYSDGGIAHDNATDFSRNGKLLAFNLWTGERAGQYDIDLHHRNSSPAGVHIIGNRLYVADAGDGAIYAYHLNSAD